MKPLQLILLYLFLICFVNQAVAQNCTINFDGETEICSVANNIYLSTIPTSIQSVEWQLDNQAISNTKDLEIDWGIHGAGIFKLCLTTSETCNASSVDPFCQMITVPFIVIDTMVTHCSGNFIDIRDPITGGRLAAFSQAGPHQYIYKNDKGCDSLIINFDLFVEDIPSETRPSESICGGTSYEIGDSIFSTSGRKRLNLKGPDGCITDVTFELEVRDPIETIIPALRCNEDPPFEMWGTTFTETGTFPRIFTAADGCDSTVIVELVILPRIDTLLIDTLCAEEIYSIGDTTFTVTGTHIYTFEDVVSVADCDSIVTIDLFIKEKIEEMVELELCRGEELPIDQDIVTLEFIPDTDIVGVEKVTGTAVSVNGCDSTIYYTFIINPTHYTIIDTILCYNSSITIGGNVFFSSTANVITLMNQYGCDSIVDYKVRSAATEPLITEYPQTICTWMEDHYIGDSLITETGHYEIIVPSYLGCDSLVIADIIAVKEEDVTHRYEDVLCTGTTYTKVEGKFLTTGGTYMFDHIESASTGCDSIIILTLIEKKTERSDSFEHRMCEGDFYVHPDFERDTLRTANIHPLSKIFPETCENFDLVVEIFFMDSIHVSNSEILCDGDSIAVGNRFYKEEGIFIDTLQRSGPMGCDSIITTTIQVRDCNMEIEEEVKPSECNGNNTGSIQFEVTEGKPPFTYELVLSEGGIIKTGMIDALLEPILFDSLRVGIYSLTLKDTVNAYKEFFLEVDQPSEFKVEWKPSQYNQFNIACEGDEDGTLELLASGGTFPYDYIWSNEATTNQLFDLSAGLYTVTVTDAMDCEYTASFDMTAPDTLSPNITVDLPNCSDLSAGEIIIRSIDGGVAPYSYKMGGHDGFSTERSYKELGPGEYTLITMDDNGCTSEFVAEMPEPEIPELLFEPDIFIDLGEEVTVNLRSTVQLVRTEWDGPEGLSCYDCEDPSIQPLDSKIFMVSVVSVDSCVTSKELTIHVNKKRDVFVPNIFSPNGDGLNDRLVIYGGPEVLSILNFEVFDRWGSKVFSKINLAPNVEEGTWDGRFADKKMRPGSFVWMARIAFIDGEVLDYYGDVVIK